MPSTIQLVDCYRLRFCHFFMVFVSDYALTHTKKMYHQLIVEICEQVYISLIQFDRDIGYDICRHFLSIDFHISVNHFALMSVCVCA